MEMKNMKIVDCVFTIKPISEGLYKKAVECKSKKNGIVSNLDMSLEYKNRECDALMSAYRMAANEAYTKIAEQINKIEAMPQDEDTVLDNVSLFNAFALVDGLKEAKNGEHSNAAQVVIGEITKAFRGNSAALLLLADRLKDKGYDAKDITALIFNTESVCGKLRECLDGVISSPDDNAIWFYKLTEQLNDFLYLVGSDSKIEIDIDINEHMDKLARLAMGLPLE